LARNEHEGMQVVAWSGTALSNVTVTCSTPQPAGGQGAFGGSVHVSLVGHVDVADDPMDDLHITYPAYVDGYTGWFSRPAADVHEYVQHQRQRPRRVLGGCRTTASTPAGDYTATITVAATGETSVTVQLNVHVWDITLPVAPSFPTAFSQNLWMAQALYGASAWSTYNIEQQFWDIQLAYRLNVTHLYKNTVDSISDMNYWFAHGETHVCATKVPTSDTSGLTSLYNNFNSQGRLDQLYVYGYDEASLDKFSAMYDTFTAIHTSYPGLRTMTTAYDASFGTSPGTAFVRPAVDIWCPTVPYFNTAGPSRCGPKVRTFGGTSRTIPATRIPTGTRSIRPSRRGCCSA